MYSKQSQSNYIHVRLFCFLGYQNRKFIPLILNVAIFIISYIFILRQKFFFLSSFFVSKGYIYTKTVSFNACITPSIMKRTKYEKYFCETDKIDFL